MATSGADVLAALEEMTDPTHLEATNSALNSLDDTDSVLVAQEVSATISRLEAVRYRALSRLSVLRGGVRSVAQEVAIALSLVDGYAGSMVDTGTALTTRLTDPLNGQVQDLGPTRYRPDAATAEFVRVRDRECRRPGCARAAHACELDHSIPWQHQGETNVADLITYCTRDHHLKDEPGWIYHLDPDGTLTITTPTGQTYRSTPPPLHDPRPEPPPF